MKHQIKRYVNEHFDEWDEKDLQAEFDTLPKGDEDDVPFEDDPYEPEEGLSDYFSEPKHKEDEYSFEVDPSLHQVEDLPAEDFGQFDEPDMPKTDKESEMKMLQQALRELPKGDPRKKELASRILILHRELSEEDEDYTQRNKKRQSAERHREAKRQDWIDSMMQQDEPYESVKIMKCSDFILLEKKRQEVLKDAGKKYPNLSKAQMKKMLQDQEKDAKSFKEKAAKYFSWAKNPEAAAAAFIRKATSKEPRDV